MKTMFISLLIFGAVAVYPSTAPAARKLCSVGGVLSQPYSQMASFLLAKYGEVADHLGTIGIGTSTRYLVQFTNKEKATMSLVLVGKGGESCMVASANNWRHTTPPTPNTGEEDS